MKLKNEPLVTGKLVRFVFVHCGTYNENEIRINGGKCSLPCERNRDSISKSVMIAQIICFIYAVIIITLDAVCLATKNHIYYYISIPLSCIYIIFAIVIFIVGEKKHNKEFTRQAVKKYEELVQQELKNNILVGDINDYLLKGCKINFKLYGLDFEFSIYKKDSDGGNIFQLVDLTHSKILKADKDLNKIIEDISINSKSLKNLWAYLELFVVM